MRGHPLEITYLGHSTTLLDFGSDCVLTDPLLRDRIWHLRRHSANFSHLLHQKWLTLILLSHLHGDHADPDSLRLLPWDVPVLAPLGAGRYLRRVIPQPVHEIAAGQRMHCGDLRIEAYLAEHPTFSPPPRPSVPCLMYVIRGPSSVLFVGDSGLAGVSAVPARRGAAALNGHGHLDAVLLPVAGFSPHLGPGHLNPHTAALACRMLRPRVATPIHWGTFRPVGPRWSRLPYLTQPPLEFAALTHQVVPGVQARVLHPGQTTVVEVEEAESISE